MMMLLLAGLFVACQQDVEMGDNPPQMSAPEGYVNIEFATNVPAMTEVAVRGVDPDGIDIQNLTLFCFNDFGLYITHVAAKLNPAAEKPSLSGLYVATIPEDTRIIHFVGNQNPDLLDADMFINRAEDEIQDDMVGASGLCFYREYFSHHYAPHIIDKVWDCAERIGYASLFVDAFGGAITDDHIYMNSAGIPSIDIIQMSPDTDAGFFPQWHTVDDNMQHIDAYTLGAVGQTVLTVIYEEK